MSQALRFMVVSSSCRISSVHGSAPRTAYFSDVEAGSMPCLIMASAMVSRYVGVARMASGLKSWMSVIWRSVWPPEIGMTVQPRASAPAWAPMPPVNRP